MRGSGYPAYTTSAGWLGYSDEKVRQTGARRTGGGLDPFQDESWSRSSTMMFGAAAMIRDEIGPDRKLMMDANQIWDVDQAIEWMKTLARIRSVVD